MGDGAYRAGAVVGWGEPGGSEDFAAGAAGWEGVRWEPRGHWSGRGSEGSLDFVLLVCVTFLLSDFYTSFSTHQPKTLSLLPRATVRAHKVPQICCRPTEGAPPGQGPPAHTLPGCPFCWTILPREDVWLLAISSRSEPLSVTRAPRSVPSFMLLRCPAFLTRSFGFLPALESELSGLRLRTQHVASRCSELFNDTVF